MKYIDNRINANIVKLEDENNNYMSEDVEGALEEIDSKIKNIESQGYDDTKIKQDINNIKNEIGTEGLTTNVKNIKGAVNEVNSQIKDIVNEIGKNGDGSDIELPTTDKTIKGAITELFQDVSNGKTLVANAITDKGIKTLATDTFQTMATNISNISGGSGGSKDAYRENRVLVWEDDFDGTELDTSIWNFEKGYIRNGEIQHYTDSNENVYVENSNLVLKAIRGANQGYNVNGELITKPWSSGSIMTNSTKEFQYGRLEAKMKVPQLAGSFPAFWTLGATYNYISSTATDRGNHGESWPQCGEIDIMEHYPGDGDTTNHGAIYNTDQSNHTAIYLGKARSSSLDLTQYHIYSLEWTQNKIEYYVDDVLISRSAITDDMYMFRMPHFIILNHAVGAVGGTPADDVNEMYVYVDWVRVYAPITESITLDKTSLNLGIGDTIIIRPTFGELELDRTLKWSTSEPAIATVYGGKIKGISEGKATITATNSNNKSASCVVTVVGAETTSPLMDLSAWTTSISAGGQCVKSGDKIIITDTNVKGSTITSMKLIDNSYCTQNAIFEIKAKLVTNYLEECRGNGIVGSAGEFFRMQVDNGTEGFAYAINNAIGVFDALNRDSNQSKDTNYIPTDAVGSINLNQEYTFKLDYDYTNKVCKFYVDGTLLRTDNFMTSAYQINAFRLGARGGSIEISDISITTY